MKNISQPETNNCQKIRNWASDRYDVVISAASLYLDMCTFGGPT